MSRSAASVTSWTLQVAVAGLLLQTLFFKFTGAEESVAIFSQLGAEPWGRYASGVAELLAALLLLTPALAPLGAGLTLAIISGAILSHVTVLGLEVRGDGGLLFGLAVTCWLGALAILFLRRAQWLPIANRLAGQLVGREGM